MVRLGIGMGTGLGLEAHEELLQHLGMEFDTLRTKIPIVCIHNARLERNQITTVQRYCRYTPKP